MSITDYHIILSLMSRVYFIGIFVGGGGSTVNPGKETWCYCQNKRVKDVRLNKQKRKKWSELKILYACCVWASLCGRMWKGGMSGKTGSEEVSLLHICF